MPQTRPNGIKVPINSDAYNLTVDLATQADTSNVVVAVASLAARNALTPGAGAPVARLDLPGVPIDMYDGAVWQDATLQACALTPTNYTTPATFMSQSVNPMSASRIGRRVHLTGVVSNAVVITFNGGTEYILGTLPAGFAPVKGEFFTIEVAFTLCRIWVRTDGQIRFMFATTLTNVAVGVMNWSLSELSWNA